jgi:hypothetical protein
MTPEDYESNWDQRHKANLRRRSLRERSIVYKGGRCEICGYDKCLSALEFHHLDPMTKEFNISDRVTTFEDIQAELDKCHLLCANCHREVHDGLHPGYLAREGDSFWVGSEVPEIPGDDLSYTEELELEAVIGLAEQAFEESTEPPLRTERKRRNIGHGSSLRRSQPRSH